MQLAPVRLWTDRDDPWDEAALRKRHDEEPRTFARRFWLESVLDGDLTFPSFGKCEVMTVLGDAITASWPCVMGVDVASKKKRKGSSGGKCIVAVKVHPGTRARFVVGVRYGAWPAGEFADNIREMDEVFRPTVIKVEDNGVQDMLIDMISDRKSSYPYWMKVEATTTTGGRKASAEVGLPALELEFSHSAWVFPKLEYDGVSPIDPDEEEPDRAMVQRRWFARLASEFRGHPTTTTSDGVMAAWFCRQAIEEYGLGLFGGGAENIGDHSAR